MNRLLPVLGICLLALSGCTPSEEPAAVKIPVLVSIPAGIFIMGDQAAIGDTDERPAHTVSVPAFAMSQYEVTQSEYAEFVHDTGRTTTLEFSDSDARHPVVNISLRDAYDYAQWLSDKTGKSFRIPSEAQWEYAAKAGSVSLFSTGNREEDVCRVGNIADESVNEAGLNWSSITACNDTAVSVSAVGQYAPNVFGLYDMHGNVWEWILDCANENYEQAPTDGTVWEEGDCARRGIRGGSFETPASSARSSNREFIAPRTKSPQIGFRVVRQG
ncbi:formylglycine-generating enzyme family protein [Teredinibacter purpureus]|uniref:formylglycine-generating enzyme family protein n=1 Tax=Teredinibacter purpureus TaxID=2731756 RepID=UPI000696CABF|nr:formylglycine-generating enzyme family protein [Teredinibacter purpureus]